MTDNSIQARQEGFLLQEETKRLEQRLEYLENCDGADSAAARAEASYVRGELLRMGLER